MSADVDGQNYVIGHLTHSSTYNVCITTVTNQDSMDLTRCVLVRTDDPPRDKAVSPRPSTDNTGIFLLVVVAVPIACLLLVLIIVCISVIACYRRRRRGRRRNKPTEMEITSSSTFDSSTGNGCQNAGNGTPCGFDNPVSDVHSPTMNMYDEVGASAPPLQNGNDQPYWNLPVQSSLSLSMYDYALSY